MHTLVALLVAAAAACAIARPPGPPAESQEPMKVRAVRDTRDQATQVPIRDYLGQILLPRLFLPHYITFDDPKSRAPNQPDIYDGPVIKGFERYREIEDEIKYLTNPYVNQLNRWLSRDVYSRPTYDVPQYVEEEIEYDDYQPFGGKKAAEPIPPPTHAMKIAPPGTTWKPKDEKKAAFASSPLEKEYYETANRQDLPFIVPADPHHEAAGQQDSAMLFEPPRQTRQNPNLSKQKNLLAPEIGKLKLGLADNSYRIPVSLLPTNLRWLQIPKQPNDDDQSSHEGDGGSLGDSTDRPRHIHMLESATDSAESIYGIALIAAFGAALTMAAVIVALGWYTLNKKAKAAADVDYPAYGVTGPTIDSSGDRKLAHSAHMYHYQHQKQQIIAMERNGMEQRAGSVSDPESEEENEEGDYTVYECPGFATTGDMEVKNPLFCEDPTPATPGKCEMVKPQPKN